MNYLMAIDNRQNKVIFYDNDLRVTFNQWTTHEFDSLPSPNTDDITYLTDTNQVIGIKNGKQIASNVSLTGLQNIYANRTQYKQTIDNASDSVATELVGLGINIKDVASGRESLTYNYSNNEIVFTNAMTLVDFNFYFNGQFIVSDNVDAGDDWTLVLPDDLGTYRILAVDSEGKSRNIIIEKDS